MSENKEKVAEAMRLMDEMRYMAEHDPERGRDMARQALALCEEAGDVEQAEDAFRLIVSATITGGEVEEAVEMSWDRLDQAQKAGNPEREAHAHMTLAEVFIVLGDTPQTLEQGEIAKNIFERLGQKKWIAKCKSNIAQSYIQAGDGVTGERMGRETLKLYQEIAYKEGEATSWHLISSARSMGGPGDQMEPLEKALQLYRELKWPRHEGIMLYNLAELKRSGGSSPETRDLAAAQRTAEEALERWRSLGYLKGEANALHSLGKALKQRGLEQDALQIVRDRYAELRAADDKRGQMFLAWASIEIVMICGGADEALALALQCLAISRALNDRHEEAWILDMTSQVRLKKGETDEALQAAQECLAIFQELGDKSGEAAAMKVLTHVYTARNEPYKAPNRGQALDNLGELAMAVQKKDKRAFHVALGRLQQSQGVDNQDFSASLGSLLEDAETYKWFTETTAEFFDVPMEEAEDMCRPGGTSKPLSRARAFDARGFAGGMVYVGFRAGMMGYGPSFRPIKELYRQGRPVEAEHPDGCAAWAVMKDDTLEEWERAALLQAHAGVLDGALQVTSALYQGTHDLHDQIQASVAKFFVENS
eukprot:TRINITY_DN1325_c0_g1_i1.p1 TRINITY_DN1325_c0_g1~~TRINITY_DN1325_c0_g1_i1.p1  ORF type:complete len:595 (-),score=121.39 TRINITY_DN1325_c0_g1_i1:272-2056(-)